MEINGIAHVILTVADVTRSKPFYEAMLTGMGMTKVVDSPVYLYFVGGRTAVGLRPAEGEHAAGRFVQGRVGLHHVCFRARSREDVDAVHDLVVREGASVVHPPREEPWVPGYYSVLFEDPDGIRLEVNHVPGRGVFEPGAKRVDATSGE